MGRKLMLATGPNWCMFPRKRVEHQPPMKLHCGSPSFLAVFLSGARPREIVVAEQGPIVSGIAGRYASALFELAEEAKATDRPQADEMATFRQLARAFGVNLDGGARPRVVLSFPQNPNDILLSGTIAGGQFLANRAAALDVPVGKGHVVMFALRPFWRWQTQGTYSLGFNALMNWNDLDAGRSAEGAPAGR